MQKILLLSILIITFCVHSQYAQSGNYLLEVSVISSGGGEVSGGGYTGTVTISQPAAGGPVSSQRTYGYIGFWAPEFAPTSANVSVSGKVTTSVGRGINNVMLTLTSMNGEISISRSSSLGYFQFQNVAVGETYILSIESKRFTFNEPSRVLLVSERIIDLSFISNEP